MLADPEALSNVIDALETSVSRQEPLTLDHGSVWLLLRHIHWLEYFHTNADFGPASEDVRAALEDDYRSVYEDG
jgi:hypothetical protein